MTHNISNIINKIVFRLKTYVKPVLRLISNKKIKKLLISINSKFIDITYRKSILRYYDRINPSEINSEKKEVLDYLKYNKTNLFPYEFINKYKEEMIEVYTDNKKQLKYVLLDNKKLFFKRGSSDEQIKKLFSLLLLVQDTKSPHRYLVDDFNISNNDIVADIGAAEGDFSLKIVEKVKRIYIFESDPELIEALQATFEPWKEKVTILNMYVSNKNVGAYTNLDSFFNNIVLPTFIKIDVEGAEYDLLCGAKNILQSNNPLKIVIAAYHRHNDEITLRDILINNGFKVQYSKGYMLSVWDDIIKEPYLRRGLIKAIK